MKLVEGLYLFLAGPAIIRLHVVVVFSSGS